jgi:hypothetical protein
MYAYIGGHGCHSPSGVGFKVALGTACTPASNPGSYRPSPGTRALRYLGWPSSGSALLGRGADIALRSAICALCTRNPRQLGNASALLPAGHVVQHA